METGTASGMRRAQALMPRAPTEEQSTRRGTHPWASMGPIVRARSLDHDDERDRNSRSSGVHLPIQRAHCTQKTSGMIRREIFILVLIDILVMSGMIRHEIFILVLIDILVIVLLETSGMIRREIFILVLIGILVIVLLETSGMIRHEIFESVVWST